MDAPSRRHRVPRWWCCMASPVEKAFMEKATIIGIDLAKRVFQVQAASKDGRPVLRKKVSRAQLLGFLAKQPPAIVAMEACVLAHDGYAPLLREVRTAIIALGVGLISRRGSTAKSGLLFQGHRWNR